MDTVTRLKNQCARREYCSSDIMSKLRREGITGPAAAAVLEELKEGRWVDDARYAGCYAREKASVAGWGAEKIRYHLSAKGMAPGTVEAALGEIDGERAAGRMRDVLAARWSRICRTEGDGSRRKTKLLRFALQRGYTVADALSVIEEID